MVSVLVSLATRGNRQLALEKTLVQCLDVGRDALDNGDAAAVDVEHHDFVDDCALHDCGFAVSTARDLDARRASDWRRSDCDGRRVWTRRGASATSARAAASRCGFEEPHCVWIADRHAVAHGYNSILGYHAEHDEQQRADAGHATYHAQRSAACHRHTRYLSVCLSSELYPRSCVLWFYHY